MNNNPSPKRVLSEKDFIQNGKSFYSFPFWIWLFLVSVIVICILGTRTLYEQFLDKEEQESPFLQVTNRELSVCLWQFPHLLRVNVAKKSNYLPGFLSTNENIDVKYEAEFVSAPPDLLFLYHTWNRLLVPEYIVRPITPSEFEEFLHQLPEWEPVNWSKAPREYVEMVQAKAYSTSQDMQALPKTTLPMIVRQAFLGWKNYFKEGKEINAFQPTFAAVKKFLEQHPHYTRSYWRNIQTINGSEIASSDYLEIFLNNPTSSNTLFPKEQIASFLQVALYNAHQAEKKSLK